MKKLFALLLLMSLGGCMVAGDFPEKRQRLYEVGNEEVFCEQHPDRCINGVAW